MVKWRLVFTRQAQKDAVKLAAARLKPKAETLLKVLQESPLPLSLPSPTRGEEKIFISPYEKLVGDLSGAYSRRINIQHRLVYQVYEKERIVKVIRMWTHYE